MSVDFTKPIYTWDSEGCTSFSNDLEKTITSAAKRANSNNGDTYYVSQVIKKISTPRPDAIITDHPTA